MHAGRATVGHAKRLLVAALALLGSHAAAAAPMSVEVEGIDDAAKSCGITRAQIERVARSRLERSHGAGARTGRLKVRVTASGQSRRDCTGRVSVRLSAQRPASAAGDASGTRGATPVLVLCQEEDTASGPRARFAEQVGSSVEYRIGRCLGPLER